MVERPRVSWWHVLALLCACMVLAMPLRAEAQPAEADPVVTTVFIVRHAQKADPHDNSQGSPLSDEGKRAAARLASALRSAHIDAVFATPTTRARDTARPTAAIFGIEVTDYPPGDPEALAASIRGKWAGRSALIVGHSNTVPALVRALGGDADGELAGDEYDNLFIVTITEVAGRRSIATTRLHLPQ